MPEIPSNQEEIVQEVSSAIEAHEKASYNLLHDRDLYLDMYNGVNYVSYKSQNQMAGLSNLPAPTVAEATETLTNTIFTMLTAEDPNFYLTNVSGGGDQSSLFKNTQLLSFQHSKTKRRKHLMAAIRSAVLNGSSFVEQPWVSWPPGDPDPAWEATSFIHRPFTNMFWMPHAMSIDYSDYIGTLDIVSAGHLRNLSGMDTDGLAWIPFNVEIALKETEKETYDGPEVRKRLTSLGYSDLKGHKELATYWGPLQSVDGGAREWVAGVVNRKFLVRLHPSPYPKGLRPIRFATHIDLENDPLGIGVGRQLKFQQRYINANLNRTMDIITLATFHILFANRYAGLKSSDMKIKPWHVIDVDDIGGIRNFPVDTMAAAHGLKLHEFLVNQARSHTGATDVLQAIVTEASAREVSIAQNNSMRAVSNKAALYAEEFLREAVYFDNYNNYLWLDRPIWINAAGMDKPLMIHPSEIAREINPVPKIITDKDYTPQKAKNTLTLLQILTSIRNQIPYDSPLWDLVSELVRELGYDPARFNLRSFSKAPNQDVMSGILSKENSLSQPPSSAAESLIAAMRGVNQIAAA